MQSSQNGPQEHLLWHFSQHPQYMIQTTKTYNRKGSTSAQAIVLDR